MVASNRMRLARELWSPLVPALLLAGAALFFGRDPGDASVPWLGLAAAALALVLFATQSPPIGAIALLPLAGLALWCAASIDWSVAPDRSWSYANRSLVFVAFAVVGALIAAEPRRLLYGFAILLGAVCVWSLAGKVIPWLYEDYGRIARLRGPIGYWNGLALLGDIALPIGLCLATRMRSAGTLLVFGWIVAIGLTYSRGGIAVGLVVVALWMVLSGAWFESFSTLLAAGIPAAATLAVAFSLSGLTSDGQTHTMRARDGIVFGIVLVLDGLIAAALGRFQLPDTTAIRRLALGFLALILAAGIVAAAVKGPSAWRSFTSSTTSEVTNSAGRLTSSGSNFRWTWWEQAWSGWKTDPLKGTGAGSFAVTNLRYRTSYLDQTTEPHDLPVQFLSETGMIGLALFLGAIGSLVAVSRRRPGPQLALALALPAYFLHGLVDFDWDFVSISAPVFLIAGTLAVRPSRRARPRAFTVVTASGIALALVFSLFSVWLGNRWDSQAAAAVGVDNGRAISLAKRARSIDPFLVDPLLTSALAESAIAHRLKSVAERKQAYGQVLGYYEKATQVQPYNALAWYELAAFDYYVRDCPQAAYTAINRFTTLNGQDPKASLYPKLLKLVNSGKARC
jgi:O-Antigen ligase